MSSAEEKKEETKPVLEAAKDDEDVEAKSKDEVGNAPPDDKHGGGQSQGINARLSLAIFAGAFGSAFQHGYHTGVLNAPQQLIMAWIKDCPENVTNNVVTGGNETVSDEGCAMTQGEVTLIWAWTVSIFCIGGMIGGVSVGFISSRYGRKGGLLLNNILVFLACGFMFAAKYAGSFHLILVGRLLIGINSGINAGISPMYLSEISPTALRGAVGTVYQLIITISILLSQVFGMGGVLGNENGWPFLLSLSVIPAVIQLILLPLCPESPKHLLLDRDDETRANSGLVWLRGKVDVHDEMDEMKVEHANNKATAKVTLLEMVKNTALRQPLIIAMMMMLAQQLSGINAAMFYSTAIFTSAGLDETAAQSATLGMGCVNVGMTFVSLVLIEKAGRTSLMIVGLAIMFVTTTLIMICLLLVASVPGLAYLSIAMVIGFVIGFATGPGSIPWFFVTELFASPGRPMATSIAVVTNWSANFLVGLGFEPIRLLVGPFVFMIFMVVQLFFIFYVKFKVPETKNRPIEEITALFK